MYYRIVEDLPWPEIDSWRISSRLRPVCALQTALNASFTAYSRSVTAPCTVVAKLKKKDRPASRVIINQKNNQPIDQGTAGYCKRPLRSNDAPYDRKRIFQRSVTAMFSGMTSCVLFTLLPQCSSPDDWELGILFVRALRFLLM